MKVSVLALTGTTLALALACVTLIQQLQAERRHARAEATLRRQWEDRFRESVRARPAPLPISPRPVTNAPGAQQDHAAPLHRDDGRSPDSWWSRFPDRLATRDGHAQLLAEQLVLVRRNNRDLAKELHLTHDEENQVPRHHVPVAAPEAVHSGPQRAGNGAGIPARGGGLLPSRQWGLQITRRCWGLRNATRAAIRAAPVSAGCTAANSRLASANASRRSGIPAQPESSAATSAKAFMSRASGQ
jgi:hypothetical protein